MGLEIINAIITPNCTFIIKFNKINHFLEQRKLDTQ